MLLILVYQFLGDGGDHHEIQIQLIHVDRFSSFRCNLENTFLSCADPRVC